MYSPYHLQGRLPGAAVVRFLLASLAVLLVIAPSTLRSQEIEEKLDAELRLILKADRQNDRETLHLLGATEDLALFVKGDPIATRAAVESLGGRIGVTVGSISTVHIPRSALGALAASTEVMRIESSAPMVIHNDRAAAVSGVDDVRQPQDPGVEPLTGEGVLVGLVDTGIDWTHPDFSRRGDSTTSRIVAIWDQNATGTPPSGYGYGRAWTREQINVALRTGNLVGVRHNDTVGHGTHTAGTAAGNGSQGRFTGMAPDADIVMVSLDVRRSTSLVEAITYIFERADELDVPSVINLSLGLDALPHDGTSLVDQAVDILLAEKPGRVVCASAGNSGRSMEHSRVVVTEQDGGWAWIRAVEPGPSDGEIALIRIGGILPIGDMPNLLLAIQLDTLDGRTAPAKMHKALTTEWRSLQSLLASGSTTLPLGLTASHPGARAYLSVAQQNEREVRFMITILDTLLVGEPREGLDYFRLMFKGAGSVHLWRTMGDTVSLDGLEEPLERGRGSWDKGWVIRSPGTARNVLTVGASNNATRFLNVLGDSSDTEPMGGDIGALAEFSSAGPALDGRMKPEIVAPGKGVISALSRVPAANMVTDEEIRKIADGGRHICMSGTSMSCPVVVGAIALYLQKYPTATFQQVKDAITTTARRDAQTASNGPLPNNFWGYGKLDIAAAIRGSSAAPLESNARALTASVAPNPATRQAIVSVDLPRRSHLTIELADLLGRTVALLHDAEVDEGRRDITADLSTLPAGAYYCTVRAGDQKVVNRVTVVGE